MKKLFLMAVAAVAMLATSCSKDDTNAVAGGEKSTVTFAVEAPVMATRADLGDGTTATDLSWAVYAEDGTYLPNLGGSQENAFDAELKANVKIDLVNGKKYSVIFWAGAKGAPYTVDFATKTMKVDATLTSNKEAYDAFYKYETIAEVSGPRTQTIVLTRPFAQLNIATADTEKAEHGGLVVAKTQVAVPAYNTLNLENGEVSGDVTNTYAFADLLTGKTIKVGDKNYDLLSMNYILVNEKELETVKFTVKNDNDTFEKEFTYNNVPLQRNHKTNIIGNILTSTLDFEITIDPIFTSEMNVEGDTGVITMKVATMAELQDAINKAKGNTVIEFEQDINAEATRAADAEIIVPQKEGVNLTIDGCGFKFDGTFYIHGNARHNGKETLTFKNINFEHVTGAIDFISSNSTGSVERYAHNVTIEDCTFTGNEEVVAMRWRQSYNIVVKNVEATNMHSLMQANGCTGIELENVVVENSGRGVSLGTSTNVNIKGVEFAVETYGIRADGSVNTTLTVADSEISAKQPIIVRKTTSDYTLNLEGENTLTTAEKYQIVFTAGDDEEEYTNPTGKVTVIGYEGFKIFKGTEQAILDDLASIEDGEEYTLNIENDIDVSGIVDNANQDEYPQFKVKGGNVTIEANGNEVIAGSTGSYGFSARNGSTLTINNANIISKGGGLAVNTGSHIIFNGNSVHVDTKSTSGRYIFYATGEGSTITINGGEFSFSSLTNKRAYVSAGAGTFVYINGGTFGKPSTRSDYKAGIMGEGTVVIKGGTFGFDPSKWVADGYKAEKSGDVWVVSFDGNVAEDVASINATLAQGGNVLLSNDVAVASNEVASNGYGATGINQNGGIIDGNGNDISVDAWGTWDSAISTSGGVIKNVNIVGGFRGIFVNKGSKVYLDNVVVDGPVYTISCDTASYQGLEAKNSTFNGWTSYAKTIGEVSFTNCQFGEGQGYAFCRPYAPTTFVGCNFEAGFAIDAREAVIFENCTLGGEALTSENIASLMAGGADKVTLR